MMKKKISGFILFFLAAAVIFTFAGCINEVPLTSGTDKKTDTTPMTDEESAVGEASKTEEPKKTDETVITEEKADSGEMLPFSEPFERTAVDDTYVFENIEMRKTDSKLETLDLGEKAVSMSDFENGLENLSYYHYGYGDFYDYEIIHRNPMESAEAAASVQNAASKIKSSTEGLYSFVEKMLTERGFRVNDLSVSYEKNSNLDKAIEAVFSVYNTTEGLEEAKQALSLINEDAKQPVAEYLFAAAAALKQNIAQNEKITDNEYINIKVFSYCAPATSNYQSLQNAYSYHKKIDEAAMIKTGALMIKASSELVTLLNGIKKFTSNDALLTVKTPAGDIIFGTSGDDDHKAPEAFLLIDPAGNDYYRGKIASSLDKGRPISVFIDYSGDDRYNTNDAYGASQGSGLFGVGLLYDMRGNDEYKSVRLSQGASFFGTGMLFDGKGNDLYKSELTSQAAGHYGLALNIDTDGDDKYQSYGYSQAYAGNRQMSFIVNIRGNDDYYVTPYPDYKHGNLVYSQYPKINGSWSQGCAAGQRNVVVSGERAVAGGYAALVDIGGNDVYTGGIWTQGVGYWAGVGMLCDVGGDDKYNSHYYSQASVAHSGAGILTDIGGDDVHKVFHDTYGRDVAGDGASIGFVWDRGVALFVNDGGDDSYYSKQTSGGLAWSAYDEKGPMKQDNTYAFFIDTEGDDYYSASASLIHYGYGRGGYFIDCGGKDKYFNAHTANGISFTDDYYTKGGVFLDHEQDTDSPVNAVVGFWEDALNIIFGEKLS